MVTSLLVLLINVTGFYLLYRNDKVFDYTICVSAKEGHEAFSRLPPMWKMTLNPFKYRISVMKRYIKEVKACHNSPQR